MNYQDINSKVIDSWCEEGWEWGQPITHEIYEKALTGEWAVHLTPVKLVPHSWFGELRGKKLLGLASGGGQQIPVFAALGADCTVLDYSEKQCESERESAEREGYSVRVIQADMTKRLPFEDETFDIIFHPVSNCYIERVEPVFRECFRVLKKGGALLGGYSLDVDYAFDEKEEKLVYTLPFDPLRDKQLYEKCVKNGWGIQFSHTIEEQVGGQLSAGFRITDIYGDTNAEGNLFEHNITSYVAVRSVKD